MKQDIWLGDCLELMKNIPDGSVDTLITDLPYGTTRCKWDSIIDLGMLWPEIWRVCKESSPVVMFGSQPFTSILVSSQLPWFKYEWIWEKSKASNFLDAKKRPLKAHESVLVFCKKSPLYNPQMSNGDSYKARPGKKVTEVYGVTQDNLFRNDNSGKRYPRSVAYFKTAESEGKQYHPTQKPIALMEYLVRTHSNEGDLILDVCAGSGSTLVAAKNLNRQFIGIEKDEQYYNICLERLK